MYKHQVTKFWVEKLTGTSKSQLCLMCLFHIEPKVKSLSTIHVTSSVSNLLLQAKIQNELKELRNKSVFFFSVFNALFVLIVFMLTLHKDTLHIDWPFGIKENITITEDEQVRTDFVWQCFENA